MPRVTVACSPAPREVFEQEVEVADGATVRDAVAASGLAQALPGLDWQAMSPGIWG
ncbi:MAG: RnfH family protein, partial [Variovorax sp.]